jgi:DNA modification methylase
LTGGHATPKPLALCGRAIKSSSREGEIVLDLFGGSGSTLIACEQLNRRACLMELEPKWCDVIIARWEKLTGKKALLLAD